jgi:XTP/dITP diphosphohydrolase
VNKVLIATSNPGKIAEIREVMADIPVLWVSLQDVGLGHMDVEETGDTFAANALLKANAYSKAARLTALADDSGIVVDALDGAPGVYSARYGPTAEARNAKLLKVLNGIPYEQRTAHFVSVIALVTPDGITVTTEGTVDGHVATEARGTNGFGYDPVFLLEDGRTMAELSSTEKNKISHRGTALAKLHPIARCMFG